MMKNLPALLVLTGLVFGTAWQQVWAGTLDLGVGLGFVDSLDSEGFEGGWDLQAGYSMPVSMKWDLGGELHLLHGLTDREDITPYDTSMYFHSTALYATAQPRHKWLRWLQLKYGIVSADYKAGMTEWSGTGTALGAGVVIGEDTLRVHLLDFYRYQLGDQSFNVYSFSIAILFDGAFWSHGGS